MSDSEPSFASFWAGYDPDELYTIPTDVQDCDFVACLLRTAGECHTLPAPIAVNSLPVVGA